MSLTSYLHATQELSRELIDSLSEKDVSSLRALCKTMGYDAWQNWFFENLNAIDAYLTATPSARRKNKPWHKDGDRLLFVLGASTLANQADALLRVLRETPIEDGISYREMAALAGRIYLSVLGQHVADWPFDPPDPFQD